jgi:hypothetical protein
VQSSPSLPLHPHRLNFYVVLRKLVPKLQAFSQSVQEIVSIIAQSLIIFGGPALGLIDEALSVSD